MNDPQEEIEHLKTVRQILTERRRWLEQQQAVHGFASSPVNILIDLDRTKKEIEETDLKLVELGEVAYLPTGLSLLERISSLEEEVQDLRKHLISTSPYRPGFSWSPNWFLIGEDYVNIHDQHFEFSDIVHFDKNYFDPEIYGGISKIFRDKVILSPDETSLALVIGEYFISYFHQMVEEERNLWGKRRLLIYAVDSKEPKFTTKEDQYVYSGPVFSSDGRHVAFAYSHDFRPSKLRFESDDGSTMEHDTADWDETVAIVDTYTWNLRELVTKEVKYGYGEWAVPANFYDLAFISNNSILFGVTGDDWGIKNVWNIPLDGSKPKIIYNPAWIKMGGDQAEEV